MRTLSEAALILVGLIFWSVLAPATAAAQIGKSPSTSIQKPVINKSGPQGAWIVNCSSVSGELLCETSQRLTLKKTGQLIITAAVSNPPNAKGAMMLLHLPHGMFLPAGIQLRIDKIVEREEAVQTCDQRGCYVRFEMADRFLNGLIKGNKFVVIFKNLQKKDFTIPLSLKGFSAAYKKMQKSQVR